MMISKHICYEAHIILELKICYLILQNSAEFCFIFMLFTLYLKAKINVF